jgi:hypothetical protein
MNNKNDKDDPVSKLSATLDKYREEQQKLKKTASLSSAAIKQRSIELSSLDNEIESLREKLVETQSGIHKKEKQLSELQQKNADLEKKANTEWEMLRGTESHAKVLANEIVQEEKGRKEFLAEGKKWVDWLEGDMKQGNDQDGQDDRYQTLISVFKGNKEDAEESIISTALLAGLKNVLTHDPTTLQADDQERAQEEVTLAREILTDLLLLLKKKGEYKEYRTIQNNDAITEFLEDEIKVVLDKFEAANTAK